MLDCRVGRGLFGVGKFAEVFFEDVAYVEIVAFGVVVFLFFDGYVVVVRFFEALFACDVSEQVYDHVFVLRVDDVPCVVFVESGSCRYDGFEQMVQAVLPDVGEIVFLFLAQCVYQEVDLPEVERIVGQRQFGIFYYGVAFGARVVGLVVLFFDLLCEFGMPIRIVVFLEYVAEIEVPVVLQAHYGLVGFVSCHELGVVVFRFRIGHFGGYPVHIGAYGFHDDDGTAAFMMDSTHINNVKIVVLGRMIRSVFALLYVQK